MTRLSPIAFSLAGNNLKRVFTSQRKGLDTSIFPATRETFNFSRNSFGISFSDRRSSISIIPAANLHEVHDSIVKKCTWLQVFQQPRAYNAQHRRCDSRRPMASQPAIGLNESLQTNRKASEAISRKSPQKDYLIPANYEEQKARWKSEKE